jgi:formylglycine-generating enzyme required for sulfatase activity
MAGKIFINYRRDDSIAAAGRLHDRLAHAFGRKNLFMDVDNIPVGVDFVEFLDAQVAACDLFLVVIGPNWLSAKDANGNRRLDKPDDFVVVEIDAALQRGIRVIPVLIDGARMPSAEELPNILKPLHRRNAVEVRNTQFGRDAEALVHRIREALSHERPKRDRRLMIAGAAGIVALLAVVWAGLYQMGVPVWVPWTAGPVQPDPAAEARRKAEEEAVLKRKIDEEAAAKKEAARKAEEEAARRKAEDDARRNAEEDVARRKAEEERKRVEEKARRDPALAVVPGSGQSFRDRLANGQPCPMCPEMVVVPAGSFTMGSPNSEAERSPSESPQHAVTFARQFAVGRFALTFDEWDGCVADGGCNGYKPNDEAWGRGRRPAINVSWDDAKAYVAWLSRKTGRIYRLLSEAEREYVTRAGTTTPFWWGGSISTSQANYDGNYTYGGGAKGSYRETTLPVDSFQPNPWGLYQVHGNVWEWVEDCWNDSYAGAPSDGSAWTRGDCGFRLVRGGSWGSFPQYLRSAYRSGYTADIRSYYIGFRVGRTLTP